MLLTKEEWENLMTLRHGKDLQEKLSATTVALCGLGGLGSNIAFSIARLGIGKLILIDYDRVDMSNLHRQQYRVDQIDVYKTEALKENLADITPFLEVECHTCQLTEDNIPELLKEADIICEAFDFAESKAMLVNTVLEKLPNKYIVSASGMAGYGSCNTIKTRRISKYFYLCGDEVSDVDENRTLFAPRVMLCAAHQANTVLRIVAGEYDT